MRRICGLKLLSPVLCFGLVAVGSAPAATLAPNAGLTGMVFLDANGNRSFDPGESPLGDVGIHLYRDEVITEQHGVHGRAVSHQLKLVQSTTTDQTGRYHFTQSGPGYTVIIDYNTIPAGTGLPLDLTSTTSEGILPLRKVHQVKVDRELVEAELGQEIALQVALLDDMGQPVNGPVEQKAASQGLTVHQGSIRVSTMTPRMTALSVAAGDVIRHVQIKVNRPNLSSLSLVARAYAAGLLTLDGKALYTAYALYDPRKLPPEYQSLVMSRSGTIAHDELLQDVTRVSPEVAAEIRSYLPSGSLRLLEPSADSDASAGIMSSTTVSYTFDGVTYDRLRSTTNFRVYWVANTSDTTNSSTDAIAEATASAMEQGYATLQSLGYTLPKTPYKAFINGKISSLGVNKLYTSGDPDSYIYIRRDLSTWFIEATAPHELFHASQRYYNTNYSDN